MTKTWISDNCDNNYARHSAELKRPQIMFFSDWLAAVSYNHLTRYLQHSLEKTPGSFISTALIISTESCFLQFHVADDGSKY